MYGKFFESTFTGSMYGSGPAVFAIWAYVLANQRNGSIELNPRMLASIIGMAEDEARATIAKLCDPDPESRNKEHEGRRLVREGEYLYTVTGYPIYSKILNESDRREYFKLKKRESRARVKEERQKSKTVKDMSTMSNMSTHSDASSDASVSNGSTHSHPSSDSGDVAEIVAYYVAQRPKKRPGASERAKVAARLKEFSVAELKEAIDGCLADPFVNEAGKVFDGLELIMRSSAKVEQYRTKPQHREHAGNAPYSQGISVPYDPRS